MFFLSLCGPLSAACGLESYCWIYVGRGSCVFVCVPHVLLPSFSRPQAGLAAVVGSHNVLKVRKQQTTVGDHALLCPSIENPFFLFAFVSFLFGNIFSLSELDAFLSRSFDWLAYANCRSQGVQMLICFLYPFSFFLPFLSLYYVRIDGGTL